MNLREKTFDRFRCYVVEDDNGAHIGCAASALAEGLAALSVWKPIRAPTVRKLYLTDGTFIGGELDSNYYANGSIIKPAASLKFKKGMVPSYNQQTRAISLVSPMVAEADSGFLQPLADLGASLFRNPNVLSIKEAARVCLSLAMESGWSFNEEIVKFRYPESVISHDSPVMGIILGKCDNWLDSLVISTLTSAGYFVVVDQGGRLVPGALVAASFGHFPVFNGVVRDRPRTLLLSLVVFCDTFSLPFYNEKWFDSGLIIRSRDVRGGPHDAYIWASTMKSGDDLFGSNLALHYVPRASDLNPLGYSDQVLSIEECRSLISRRMSVIYGVGSNVFFSYDIEHAHQCFPVTNDIFSDGFTWENATAEHFLEERDYVPSKTNQ